MLLIGTAEFNIPLPKVALCGEHEFIVTQFIEYAAGVIRDADGTEDITVDSGYALWDNIAQTNPITLSQRARTI